MTKIAFFLPNFMQGGAETVTVSIANFIAENNLNAKIYFLVASTHGPLKGKINSRINILNLNCKKTLFSLMPISKFLLKEKPDVLFSTLKENNAISILAKIITLSKTKIVIREANTLSSEFSREKNILQQIKKILVKYLYPKADLIIALSNHMKKDIISFIGKNNVNISVIYNPINMDYIHKLSLIKNEDYIEFNKTRKNIVSIARLYKSKGYLTILEALALYKEKNNNFHFYAIGDGPEKKQLKDFSNKLGLSEHVSFLGFKENPFNLLTQADCFILASLYEGMPNSLLQAMALDIPVICTNSPGASAEVLGYGSYGKLIEISDSINLSKNLDDILSNDYKANTKKVILERHNHEVILTKYMNSILGILKK
ncbi:glycosyltransferase [Xenorhabdus ishibashii]|uniref:General glycosylation pathway protein n=1 Tax=Xenorhabdus ishibashii TaxID=1034471 RepID=A0A2D0KG60_9GAMM|nr:glycosyltransferase [Xenorhabdus ishibashii]PHM62372.1 general glycosylation pathway protein [Xenorhabdus ishibashii]